MDRQQLLTRLNHRSRTRYGVAVTDRMLRDLIDEHLADGPVPHGRQRGQPPDWAWGRSTYRQVLQVCRLKALGCRRFDEIRVGAWLRGSDTPLSESRDSLGTEFRRRQNQLFHQINVTRDPRTPEGKKKGIRGLKSQMGAPSPLLLPPGIEFPTDLTIAVFDSIRFGVGNAELVPEIQAFFRVILNAFPISEIPDDMTDLLDRVSIFLAACFEGIVGEPDEITKTGLDLIASSTEKSLLHARKLMHIAENCLHLVLHLPKLVTPAFKLAASELVKPYRVIVANLVLPFWRLSLFMLILNAVHNSGDDGQEYMSIAGQFENRIREMITKIDQLS